MDSYPKWTATDVSEQARDWLVCQPLRTMTEAEVRAEVLACETWREGCDDDAEWRAAVLSEVLRLLSVPSTTETAREHRDRMEYEYMHRAGAI